MACRHCYSESMATFPSEVRLYLNRTRTISSPPLVPAPEIVVCLDCGFSEFVIAPGWLAAGWLRSFRPAASAGTPAAQEPMPQAF